MHSSGFDALVGVSIAVAAKIVLAHGLDMRDTVRSAAVVLPVRDDQVQGKVPLPTGGKVHNPLQNFLREFLRNRASFHPA